MKCIKCKREEPEAKARELGWTIATEADGSGLFIMCEKCLANKPVRRKRAAKKKS